ncbi:MAG: PhnD/SsuA/transferrin family substrate-binding protein [Betaproteobacteria bacterium]
MIANARMYSVNAATEAAWRELLAWVAARADFDCEVIDYPAPQPLPELWARADLGCAFMCGYPLSQSNPQPVVLAAPVPSPERYEARPVYWTDLVVRDDSSIVQPVDALGRRMAYTTPGSQSGYQAPRHFFARYASFDRKSLFSDLVGPLITPRRVVTAIVDGDADIGPVDSYALDLLRLHEPALVARLRIVASTPPTPIPPLVAAPTIAPPIGARLTAALLAVGAASALQAVRRTLLLRGFVAADTKTYDLLAQQAADTDRTGYVHLQ